MSRPKSDISLKRALSGNLKEISEVRKQKAGIKSRKFTVGHKLSAFKPEIARRWRAISGWIPTYKLPTKRLSLFPHASHKLLGSYQRVMILGCVGAAHTPQNHYLHTTTSFCYRSKKNYFYT